MIEVVGKMFFKSKILCSDIFRPESTKTQIQRLFLSDGNVLIVTRTNSLKRYWGKEIPYGLKAKIEKSIWFAFALMKSAK